VKILEDLINRLTVPKADHGTAIIQQKGKLMAFIVAKSALAAVEYVRAAPADEGQRFMFCAWSAVFEKYRVGTPSGGVVDLTAATFLNEYFKNHGDWDAMERCLKSTLSRLKADVGIE
jgi:hypothetical protein